MTDTISTSSRLSAVHDQLMTQLASFVTSSDWRRFLDLATRFHDYSANNCLLILAQCPHATRVASFTTWRSLGRRVRRGEHGIAILAPRHAPTASDSSPDAPRRLTGFVVVHVFDVSQTEGAALDDDITPLLTGGAPAGMWDQMAALVRDGGYALVRGDCAPANGYTNRETSEVMVSRDLGGAAAVKTLVHELAHVRQSDEHLATISRAVGEVEAESVAYVVCHAYGLSSATYSLGYVTGWAGGDLDLVRQTAQWVVETSRGILGDRC